MFSCQSLIEASLKKLKKVCVNYKETILFNGFKFHRYPRSKHLTDRRYFKGYTKESGEWKKKYFHRYKWELKNGPIPEGFQIHHIDGNTLNNDIKNLELVNKFKHLSDHGKIPNELRLLGLVKAQKKAKEWHASTEGREWHRQHAYKTIQGEPRQIICIECGTEATVTSLREAKFCSKKCKDRFNMRKYRKDRRYFEKRECVICNKEYHINRFSKTRTCSFSCAALLRKTNIKLK